MLFGSNDGSHFLILRSITSGQLAIVPEKMPYTGYVGFAEYEGRRYSDRPPGLALLAISPYLVAKGLASVLPFQLNPPEAETLLGGDKNNNVDFFPFRSFGIAAAHLIPIFFSAATLVLLFNFLSLYTTRNWLSVSLVSLFGLGTLFVKYATVFYSHNISVFTVMAAVLLIFRIRKTKGDVAPFEYKALGFSLGFMALLEYQMIVFGIGALAVILARYREFFRITSINASSNTKFLCRDGVRIFTYNHSAALSFLWWGAWPILLMALYQAIMFNNPFETTYAHHGFYLYAKTFSGIFSGNIKDGLLGLLFLPHRNGLLLASPFIFVGVIAATITIHRSRAEKIFFLLVAIANILIIAKFKEWHGGGFYPRYISWSSLLLFLAGALWCIDAVNRLASRDRKSSFNVELILVTSYCVSAVYGIYNNVIDLPKFFSSLKIWQLEKAGEFALSSYFPGLIHWPLLILNILIFLVWHYRKLLLTKKALFFRYFKLAIVLFLIFVAALLINQASQFPDWRKRNIAVLDNFHVWNTAQAYKSAPGIRMLETHNIMGGYGIAYPEDFDEPGVMAYRLPSTSPDGRIFLFVDITVAGVVGSSAKAELIDSSGKAQPIFSVLSDGTERRYSILKEVSGIDVTTQDNFIKVSLMVRSGSKTNFDVRLESLEIYSI